MQRESKEQEALIEYCEYTNVPIFAIPNGGFRDKKEAYFLKRTGVKAGVPDLFVPVARGGFFGLFIEMKWGRNKTTPQQDEWLGLLAKNHYRCCVCYGADAAVKAIKAYMKEPPTYNFVLGTPAK